ncbi:hypothetical protein [Pantoea agglomerans]|uniref:hypothetical protein n=1 Tax=Enterobacter agglomerans TaxID=549 RepID=UPI0015EBA5D3|nr:hypothetical protein [Pantoea agglomerans]
MLEEWTKDDGTKVSTPTILVRDIDLPPKQSGQQQSRPQQLRGQSTEPDYDTSIPF